MSVYVGVGNKARKVSKIYVGDSNNKAKEITKAYVGINNVARQTYTSYVPPVQGNPKVSFYLNASDAWSVQASGSTSQYNFTQQIFSAGNFYSVSNVAFDQDGTGKYLIDKTYYMYYDANSGYNKLGNKIYPTSYNPNISLNISSLNLDGSTRPFKTSIYAYCQILLYNGSQNLANNTLQMYVYINFDGTNVTYDTSSASGDLSQINSIRYYTGRGSTSFEAKFYVFAYRYPIQWL